MLMRKKRWIYFLILILLHTSIVVHADVSSGDAVSVSGDDMLSVVSELENDVVSEDDASGGDVQGGIDIPAPAPTEDLEPTAPPAASPAMTPMPTASPEVTLTPEPTTCPKQTEEPGATVSGSDIESTVSGNDGLAEASATPVPSATPMPERIIQVSLPTDFDVIMFIEPNTKQGYIWSQDIVMINESDFPVDVIISSVRYQIAGEDPAKTAQLSVKLKQFGQEEQWFDLQEGETPLALRVPLESKKATTDMASLQRTTFNSMGTIASGDYATINIEGTISRADWRADDLTVSVVYDLAEAGGIVQ